MFMRITTKKKTQTPFLAKAILCLSAYTFLAGTEATAMLAVTNLAKHVHMPKSLALVPYIEGKRFSTQVSQTQTSNLNTQVSAPTSHFVGITIQLDKKKQNEFVTKLEDFCSANAIPLNKSISLFEIYASQETTHTNYPLPTVGC